MGFVIIIDAFLPIVILPKSRSTSIAMAEFNVAAFMASSGNILFFIHAKEITNPILKEGVEPTHTLLLADATAVAKPAVFSGGIANELGM